MTGKRAAAWLRRLLNAQDGNDVERIRAEIRKENLTKIFKGSSKYIADVEIR